MVADDEIPLIDEDCGNQRAGYEQRLARDTDGGELFGEERVLRSAAPGTIGTSRRCIGRAGPGVGEDLLFPD